MMDAHSRLHAPSSAARRLQCAGSAKAEAERPDDDSEESREGTAAHWVLSECLQHGILHPAGSVAPNGYVITDEMIEGRDCFVEHITRLAAQGGVSAFGSEVKVRARRIHPECWGTLDYYMVIHGAIHLLEYKFGHRYVEVFENPQLAEYLSALLDLLNFDDSRPVTFHIVQPRYFGAAGPVRSWEFVASDMRALWNKLSAAEVEAEHATPLHTVGPECRDCKARAACPTLQRAAAEAIAESSRLTPFDLPPDAVGVELRYLQAAADRLKARISGLQAQAMQFMQEGHQVPHWQLTRGQSRLKWNRPIDEVIQLGDLFGKDLRKPRDAITPTQAKKLGIDEAVISAYAERQPGALSLEPVTATDVAKTFYTRGKA